MDLGLMFIALIAVSYPLPTNTGNKEVDEAIHQDRAKKLEDCALLIAHFGPRGPLEATLKAAVNLFPLDNIFVCHNGNAIVPNDGKLILDTFSCCKEVTEQFKSSKPGAEGAIRYVWSAEGNKSIAIYLASLLSCKQKYVCVMDNDCILPEDLQLPTELMEIKENVRGVGFSIRASNIHKVDTRPNFWPVFQDIEYKKAGITKLFQSQMGSTMFAHGAFGMWRRDTLVEVMMRHNTNFHGEDMQMGLILHSMNKGYALKYVANVPIGTRTPAHFICCPWNTPQAKNSGRSAVFRMLTAPYRCTRWGCKHEEKSLFCQRTASWDAGAFRLFFTFLVLTLSVWNRQMLNLKLYLVYELWSLVLDCIRIPLLIIVIYNNSIPFLAASFALFIAGAVVLYIVLDVWTLRKRRDIQSGIIPSMAFIGYSMVLALFRQTGLLYNIAVSLPRSRIPRKIKNRSGLPSFIDGRFISDSFADPIAPSRWEERRVCQDSRISPKLRGAKRTKANDGWHLIEYDNRMWNIILTIPDKAKPSSSSSAPKTADQLEMAIEGYFVLFFLFICAGFLGVYVQDTLVALLAIFIIFAALLYCGRTCWE
eukprot:ANDGO_01650.mRNA.1 hypothetical protein Pmar_PMAR028345